MEVEVPPTPVVEPVKVKKPVSEAKRKQLEGARERKANQKKAIEPDSDSSEEDEPVKKKSKVITKGNSGSDMEEWSTTAIRTAALVSLAGATFYMQNIYGKKKYKPLPLRQPLLHKSRRRRCKLTCFQLSIDRMSVNLGLQFSI